MRGVAAATARSPGCSIMSNSAEASVTAADGEYLGQRRGGLQINGPAGRHD